MKFSLILLALFFTTSLVAQKQGDRGLPKGLKRMEFLKSIDKRFFSEPNVSALRAEDALVDNTGTAPWRFGHNNYTQLNLQNAGSWIELPNGDKLWLLEINCENALTVNLTFANTEIPSGNELYVFNKEKDFILGKFTVLKATSSLNLIFSIREFGLELAKVLIRLKVWVGLSDR
jgi:lysyl endopeptidase